MKLSTLIIAASLALPLAVPAAAHNPGDHRGEKLIEALELDDARADEVRKVLQATREKREQLHRDTRNAAKQIHAQSREQLKQILTKEEIARLDELKAQKRKAHVNRHHSHHFKNH